MNLSNKDEDEGHSINDENTEDEYLPSDNEFYPGEHPMDVIDDELPPEAVQPGQIHIGEVISECRPPPVF